MQEKANSQQYKSQTKPPSEINRLNAAIKQNPTNASLYIAKADDLVRTKAPPEKVINTFVSGIKNNPNNQQLRMGLGNYYLAKGDYKKASKEYEKVIKINPSMSEELKHLKPYFSSKGVNFNLKP